MFDGLSKEDVLKMWLTASVEFSQAPTPQVTAFGRLTGQVYWHFHREGDLSFAVHVVEEIAGARAATNPDKVDKVLLRSRLATSTLRTRSQELCGDCVEIGIMGASASEARLEAISHAIKRRRSALGVKGRSYLFD